jgi:hypothetical protein
MTGMKSGPGDNPFGDEDEEEEENTDAMSDMNAESAESDQNAMDAMSADDAMNAWSVKNVKSDWNGKTVYLPDHLDELLNNEYDRLVYELDREIKKDRHYKPLIIALALDRLEGMERDELTAFMERMEDQSLFEDE